MKKIKYLIFMLIFLFTKNVYAIDNCTSTEIQRLRELANNVEIKYESKFEVYDIQDTDEKDMSLVYNLKMLNNNDDLKFYYQIESEASSEATKNEIENLVLYEGQVISIKIYSWTNNNCTDELLRTITIKLPVYNRFYYNHKEECAKYEDFKYCEEYLDNNNLDIDEIEELFEKYQKNNPDIKKEQKLNIIDLVKTNKLYFIVGGGILIISFLTIIIIFIRKKHLKNEL